MAAAPTRIVIAVGEESLGTFTGRAAVATAELLGQQATVFPSHHGGFLGAHARRPYPRSHVLQSGANTKDQTPLNCRCADVLSDPLVDGDVPAACRGERAAVPVVAAFPQPHAGQLRH